MNVTALNDTAKKYEKPLVFTWLMGIKDSLRHMVVKTSIQSKAVLTDILGNYELPPINIQTPHQQNSGMQAVVRQLEVHLGQVLAYENPEDLRDTILGEMLVGDTKPVTKHPLEAQIITAVVNSIGSKLNGALFSAVRNPSGTTTKDLFDGFDTLTAAAITAGEIDVSKGNIMNLGTIDSTNACDALIGLWRSASDDLRMQNTKLFVPFGVKTAYDDNYRDDFGPVIYNSEFVKKFVEGTENKCELVWLPGKTNSPYLHLTTRENMVVGMDQPSDMDFVKVREVENPNVLQFVLNALFGVQMRAVYKEKMMVAQYVLGS